MTNREEDHAYELANLREEKARLLSVIHTAATRLWRNEEDYPGAFSVEDVDYAQRLLAQTFLDFARDLPDADRFETAEYVVISRSLMDELERQAGLESVDD